MKGERDTTSDTASSKLFPIIPTLLTPPPPLIIPPDLAEEGVIPAPDRLFDPHPLTQHKISHWAAAPDPDWFLASYSMTLAHIQSEARLEAPDAKNLSGQDTEEPCWKCCSCTIS
ncbi:MAG: hypothetical protein H0U78_01060 [Rickettsiaceae bacterium]|nr:hypothetical protein [Rickettsiaceae bacterium]